MNTKKTFRKISAVLLTGFGLITLFLSTSIILDLFGIREKEGNYVLFIVWANFISSLMYLFAAYGFVKVKKWTTVLLGITSLILIISFILFTVHIANDGIYEIKTVGAMIFRIGLTLVFTIVAYFTIQEDSRRN